MDYEPVDRVPYWELGLWGHTYERWYAEGMPADEPGGDFFEGGFWGIDRRSFADIRMHMIPWFEAKVLEEDDRTVIAQHANGIVTKALKEGTVRGTRPSMDQYLRFPVETMQDFEDLKKRYDPHDPARRPADWAERVRMYHDRTWPLCLLTNAAIGFYSNARSWMGTENLSLAFHDQPKLIHAMMEFIGDFLMEAIHDALHELDVDYFNLFEDMAYKTGPLISPDHFREFIFPHYRRVIEFLHRHGVRHVSVDSDGNTEKLIPLWLEAGVDTHWPFECAADMDPVRIRREFGRDLRIWGGIDKRALTKGKREIEEELFYKMPPLLEDGGYAPHIDHTVPPDVSWANFQYYMELRRETAEGKHGG
jgi:uroporphyrinogen decarboxylase